MKERLRFVSIAKAHDQTEAIQLRLLFDRIQIPYRVSGEHLHSIYGMAATTVFGPMEFMVPEDCKDEAEAAIGELFNVDPGDIPENCPACSAKVPKGKLDCPDCELSLA